LPPWGTFAPYVAGKNEAGDWLHIYYFDIEVLKAGWSPRSQLAVTDADLNKLPIIDPANPPELPELPDSVQAARPYGARISATTVAAETPVVQPTAGPQPNPPSGTSGSGNTGGQNPPPTEAPPSPPDPGRYRGTWNLNRQITPTSQNSTSYSLDGRNVRSYSPNTFCWA
jgi:hypothetical protein